MATESKREIYQILQRDDCGEDDWVVATVDSLGDLNIFIKDNKEAFLNDLYYVRPMEVTLYDVRDADNQIGYLYSFGNISGDVTVRRWTIGYIEALKKRESVEIYEVKKWNGPEVEIVPHKYTVGGKIALAEDNLDKALKIAIELTEKKIQEMENKNAQ